MTIELIPAPLDELRDELWAHLAGLPAPPDSFYEDQIVAAAHYRIAIGGAAAGFASVNGGAQLVQFSLRGAQRRHGQAAYGLARRLESVRGALAPTWDEFFLAHALDDCVRLEKQAHIFEAPARAAGGPAAVALRPATAGDAELIARHSGDFFNPLAETIASGDLHVAERDGDGVGFGILSRSKLGLAVASAGMFTLEARRRQGVGAAIIAALIGMGQGAGLTVTAGCWYYNHRSKQTLERAGMAARGRLLSIGY